ncbi:hypothetical protein IEO70_14345 [Bacillus sp. AGMB 02131]|uniref:Uncharacterized protein n=1 Tax=Peribacillus faecalis TaxID=2772559 RepID=A0A927D0X7_9BACI|nr:hypothetical protein [Peribacillus faecalis]MBD3109525.1 hypothetical protein [Peribacillus faecalis]
MPEQKCSVICPQELEQLKNEGLILSPMDQRYGLIGYTEEIANSYLLRIFAIKRDSIEEPFHTETEVASFIAKEKSLMSTIFHQVTNLSAFQYLLMVNQQQLLEHEKELRQH